MSVVTAAKPTYAYPFNELPFFGKNQAVNLHLSKAAQRLTKKLASVAPNLKEIGMSAYSQRYMNIVFGTNHRRHRNLTKYGHLLSKALEPYTLAELGNLTLVDYGGGHGTLSLLAKEAGVGEVIHSDIFETSSMDARLLAKTIAAAPGPFFLGDTPDFREQMGSRRANVIVNYDVLEHVYNFRQYFIDLAAVTMPGGNWYMGSGANQYNTDKVPELLEIHDTYEIRGDGDTEAAYINVRARHIAEFGPDLLPDEIAILAKSTRGWRHADIKRAVDIYVSSGHVVEFCPPLTNTADPRNGNWAENLVPIETYTDSTVLRGLAKSIKIEAGPEWASYVTGDTADWPVWSKQETSDVKKALRRAFYYCVAVHLK